MSTKQYIGISRDHSMSMTKIAGAAKNDYNQQIKTIKEVSDKHDIDTIVTVVNCGVTDGSFSNRGAVTTDVVNSSVNRLKSLDTYVTNGGSTPLFDSIHKLIELMQQVPDAKDPKVSFLVQVITDGQDNCSSISAYQIAQTMRKLQDTGRWSFTFRVPYGYARALTNMGIPMGNIIEWEQTEQGMYRASVATTQAYDDFYVGRTKGLTGTRGFYSDLSNVSSKQVKSKLNDITKEIEIFSADKEGEAVNKFVLRKTGNPLIKGTMFYELTKHERALQDYKKIIIQDLKNGGFYTGFEARNMLGLPDYGSTSISPGDHAHYKIYVQSTSLNRKLKKGTSVVFWNKVR